MPALSFHIAFSGSAIAAYAAVVATSTAAVQIFNYLRDRARIKLEVRRNMQFIGDSRFGGQSLTLVSVANHGRRPVTITTVGALRLYPHDHIVIPQSRPALPYELTEGKSLIAIIPPCDLDFTAIDMWEAYDAVGHRYVLRVAPWYVRVLSNLRWRRQWRRAAKAHRSGSVKA